MSKSAVSSACSAAIARARVLLLQRDLGHLRVRAVVAGRDRHERRGAFEGLHRAVEVAGLPQRLAERHLRRVAARVLRRRTRCSVVERHLRQVDAFGGIGSARAQRAEHLLERLVERRLQLVEVGVERRLQRRVGVEPLAVGAQQLVQPRLAVGRDDVLDEQRRLVSTRARSCAAVGERRVQVAQLQRLAAVEQPANVMSISRPHSGAVRASPRTPKCLRSASAARAGSTSAA